MKADMHSCKQYIIYNIYIYTYTHEYFDTFEVVLIRIEFIYSNDCKVVYIYIYTLICSNIKPLVVHMLTKGIMS